MVSDEILSREAFFIYNYTAGFIPYQNRLDHWIGTFRDANGTPHQIEVIMPPDFPNQPPIVKIDNIRIEQIQLPFKLRSLERWNFNSHLFHVMVELSERIKEYTLNIQNIDLASLSHSQQIQLNEKSVLRQQIMELEQKIAQKKKELQNIRSQKTINSNQSDIEQMIEDGINQLEAELFMIEKQFEKAELETEEFVKKYNDTAKRLETLKIQKEKIKT